MVKRRLVYGVVVHLSVAQPQVIQAREQAGDCFQIQIHGISIERDAPQL
jgi:hypothetical protein